MQLRSMTMESLTADIYGDYDGFISGHVHGYHLLQASLEAHQIKNPSRIGTIHPERQRELVFLPPGG